MNNDVFDMAIAWIGLLAPEVATPVEVAKHTMALPGTISDRILSYKLYRVLSEQEADFEKRLKISEKFEEDSKCYYKMVHQLIYYVNAINEEDLLRAYANLLKAYTHGFICKNDFFRLAFALTKLLSEDARFLSQNIKCERIEENLYCLSLSSNNLMYNMSRGFADREEDEEKEYYCFTEIGKMLDKYALSYGDETKYDYRKKDAPLSEQKLSYTYLPRAEDMLF